MVTIAKIDVDVKMDNVLLVQFLGTRLAIIEHLGYHLKDVRWRETTHGYHFWFEIEENLTDNELANLQFLLGDDQIRSKYNFMRVKGKAFRDFNALFSKKVKKRRTSLVRKLIIALWVVWSWLKERLS